MKKLIFGRKKSERKISLLERYSIYKYILFFVVYNLTVQAREEEHYLINCNCSSRRRDMGQATHNSYCCNRIFATCL